MATITKLKSGKFRAQVRRRGFYRNQTFNLKRDAVNWASQIEAQISTTAANGLIQSKATLAKLIETYLDVSNINGWTPTACYARLSDRLGSIKLNNLTQIHIQDYTDKRWFECRAVTVAQDLSCFSKVCCDGRSTLSA